MTIFIFFSNLSIIKATVDRIIIIDHGQIVADGTTKKLMSQFMGNIKLTLEIVGLTDNKIKKFKDIFSKIKISKSQKSHIVNLEYKKRNDPRKDIFNFIVKNNLSLLEMSTQTANLEDIFRKLTKQR